MEPRREERKDREPRSEAKEAKPRRFRIVKLEERIAPSGNGSNGRACYGNSCFGTGGPCGGKRTI
jgi:hypothetical protein